jgi:hypothetical protein
LSVNLTIGVSYFDILSVNRSEHYIVENPWSERQNLEILRKQELFQIYNIPILGLQTKMACEVLPLFSARRSENLCVWVKSGAWSALYPVAGRNKHLFKFVHNFWAQNVKKHKKCVIVDLIKMKL